jgi:hypothetical protein
MGFKNKKKSTTPDEARHSFQMILLKCNENREIKLNPCNLILSLMLRSMYVQQTHLIKSSDNALLHCLDTATEL